MYRRRKRNFWGGMIKLVQSVIFYVELASAVLIITGWLGYSGISKDTEMTWSGSGVPSGKVRGCPLSR